MKQQLLNGLGLEHSKLRTAVRTYGSDDNHGDDGNGGGGGGGDDVHGGKGGGGGGGGGEGESRPSQEHVLTLLPAVGEHGGSVDCQGGLPRQLAGADSACNEYARDGRASPCAWGDEMPGVGLRGDHRHASPPRYHAPLPEAIPHFYGRRALRQDDQSKDMHSRVQVYQTHLAPRGCVRLRGYLFTAARADGTSMAAVLRANPIDSSPA
eukprot:761351-Hanusia_phi.AAC.2